MLCLRAPRVCVMTMKKSSDPLGFQGGGASVVVPSPFLVEGALLFCSHHSWLGHLAVRAI